MKKAFCEMKDGRRYFQVEFKCFCKTFLSRTNCESNSLLHTKQQFQLFCLKKKHHQKNPTTHKHPPIPPLQNYRFKRNLLQEESYQDCKTLCTSKEYCIVYQGEQRNR